MAKNERLEVQYTRVDWVKVQMAAFDIQKERKRKE